MNNETPLKQEHLYQEKDFGISEDIINAIAEYLETQRMLAASEELEEVQVSKHEYCASVLADMLRSMRIFVDNQFLFR